MIYPDNFEEKIGFDRIRKLIAENCLSPMGIEGAGSRLFSADPETIDRNLSATFEFQKLLRLENNFPSDHYFDTSRCLNKLRPAGSFPEVQEVFELKKSLETVRAVTSFFKRKESEIYPVLRSLSQNVKIYPYVLEASDRIIDKNGNVKDNASPKLREIRNDISVKSALVIKRLNSILRQAQTDGIVDADTSASVRNGRGVIPVNTWDKRKIKGLILDQSASGKTVFIEPEEIIGLNNEIIELEYDERREIVRILTAFADDIRPYIDDLLQLNGFLGEIDFIRAKAIVGNQLGSIKPVIGDKPGLSWRRAIHPILDLTFRKTAGRKVVPLDIELDEKDRILLISGPNAGGKSVCLKTVGLLQYMLQCGLTIPVSEGSESGIFENIFIDIGDEQSIDNDLSTYSSHLIGMKYFVRFATDRTLLLIDEFGTGTEPMLGGSIAEAILGELLKSGTFGVITTHYTNLKHFASLNEGIINGAMLFDTQLMQPLFQLSIGRPGSSFAFEIAKKIGLPENILKTASEKAGIKNINYDKSLKDIARDRRYWETKRQNIRQHEKRLEELIEEYEKELAGAKSVRKEIISKAKTEAESLLEESNRIIERTVREIRESQAEKEKIKGLRQQLEEFKVQVSGDPEASMTKSEEKASRLKHKADKLGPRVVRPVNKPIEEKNEPLKPGDAVRMTDTMAVGEIVRVDGQMAQVEAGSIILVIPVTKLERISRAELKKTIRTGQVFRETDPAIEERKLSFRPEIDIRGVRGEEALRQVRDFIDDAVMVQHRNLRILHGKGNGILRQLVREYLATVNVVKSFRDEHVELGGSGVTVVEMDI
ncbi:MAG: Smr/MutS family protein [Bacteroidales bacterium]